MAPQKLTLQTLWRAFQRDPRHYQIGVLSSLILLGVFHFAFQLPWWHVVACVGSTLTTQYFADRMVGRKFDARSPLISALSLTILLRTGSVWLSIGAGVLAVASKYLIRVNGKHIFNPANFGLVIMAFVFSGAWISPGQWGAAPIFAILLAGLGGAVTGKAKRWDVSVAFLAFYAALVFGRALWLGDPLNIPLHQMQSGALLIFAFFMISDPKTTPDARLGRVVYAALVASVGFTIQFGFYNSAGIILALILTAPTVPFFDKIFKDAKYQWPSHENKTRISPPKSAHPGESRGPSPAPNPAVRFGRWIPAFAGMSGIWRNSKAHSPTLDDTSSPSSAKSRKGVSHETIQTPAE